MRRPSAAPRSIARRLAKGTTLEYQLRVELGRIEPLIWRQVRVADDVTLAELHTILQKAMGWHDVHLHEFRIGSRRYGLPVDNGSADEPVIDERRARLKHLIEAGVRNFAYLYDLDDHWEHSIRVEHLALPQVPGGRLCCVAGENACPPDDVGGVPGYFEFLRALRDPTHPRHSEMRRWIGGSFDPAAFDITAVNERLATIKH